MTTDTAHSIDPLACARWQNRTPSHSPWLHEEVARRMMERLDFITLQPKTWLNWYGAHGGLQAQQALQQRYPQATVWQMPAQTPPAPHSMDMIWANMSLHTVVNVEATLTQWRKWLSPTGFVMFSALGFDSLGELRQLYQQRGWAPPCHAFADMHDLGDLLMQTGFADPVIDTEHITLTFPNPQRLLQELREIGRNLAVGRDHTTHGRNWLGRWYEAVGSLAQANGELPLTFEVIYGHAVQSSQNSDEAGNTTIDLVQMRHMLRSAR